MRPSLSFAAVAVAPLVLTIAAFVAVLRAGPSPAPLARRDLPQEAYSADHCTWWCHNHGCAHHPILGAFLAGDQGLFGWTVGALHTAGDAVSPGARGVGYGAVNLAVFCAGWPALTVALWVVAVGQRRAILAGRRPRRKAA